MKIISGKVVSIKMDKTIVIEVERKKIHPLYKKIIKSTKKYKVHNEDKNIKLGDVIKIKQSRPISKEKHYIILK